MPDNTTIQIGVNRSPPVHIKMGSTILVNQVINQGDIGLTNHITIDPSMLVGSIYVWNHGLNTNRVDVTISDSQGEISIPWRTLSPNHIELNFFGLVPLTQFYNILIEGY